MKIKCRKGTLRNILYFSVNFTHDEILNNQDRSYDIKCHFKALPQPYGISTDYILHDVQLCETFKKDLGIKLRCIHPEDKSQVLVFSIDLPPEGDFVDFHILLDCGNSYACNPKFRSTACESVKEILQFILNRQKGAHCATCIYKYQKRLSGKCGELYKFNKW